ncbi:MAG: 7-cyano-7-deazaguanine synthase QueC [Lentisphaerae bacterium RIFOXYB12_FULL_65_16]|nr:MAG: 7-cyano-7-deazaguanine synthase QueC [Lentisphaerae bacterium RIFOXYA12_64_32]OGV88353.1 MAG: 7-cyano-7-deazaguanine synthase QueC [Lentisphaerae bacterium RIFOXYB12_FULL_65_16]
MTAATVLLSGGLDSTVLLHHVVKELGSNPVHVLSFRYGQRHSRELDMARWQAGQLPQVAGHHVVDIGVYADLVGSQSSLIRGGPAVPRLENLSAAELHQPSTYVPNRNMILLSLAAAFAEARGCPVVFYGAQAQDQYGYWDCTPEFVRRINEVLALNRGCAVRVEAPFAGRRKAENVRLGGRLGVDFGHTWSCYRGEERPCRECPSCVERQRAFDETGVRDPLG